MGKYSYFSVMMMFAITFSLWIIGVDSFNSLMAAPLKTLSQIMALFGGTGYLLTFFFSSRLPLLEKLRIPLDKSYKIHRLIGAVAGAGIVLHVTTLIANLLPSAIGISLYLIPGSTLSYTFGIIAFYLILMLLFTTFYANLPYHIWKVMHQVAGVSVVFAFLHMVLIPSDISHNLPLRFWMLSLGVLALISWAYKLFLYNWIAFKSEYSIVEVARDESVLKITMVATKNQIQVSPGQFAFFSFRSSVKAITKEAHPFTILNAEGNSLTIAVKYLGDFTYKLQQLVAGDKVKVAGPYGSFGDSYLNSPNDAVWIAGGIGVTPFVNLVAYAQLQRFEKPTTFYYTTREEDKMFHPTLMQQVSSLPISYHYVSSDKQGRLMPEKVVAGLSKAPQMYDYFICGPKGLLVSTVQYLQKIGINSSQIHVEDFDFRDLEI